MRGMEITPPGNLVTGDQSPNALILFLCFLSCN